MPTFPKAQKLCSQKLADRLFTQPRRHSAIAYPLRVVWLKREAADRACPLQLLISVPKRHLKHAVDRNRAKRQVREAYRLQKESLEQRLAQSGAALAIALLWVADTPQPTAKVNRSVRRLLDTLPCSPD